jgi:tRNA-Thr(GGU) m(6)t(6)A37 methyltransferase TsaA
MYFYQSISVEPIGVIQTKANEAEVKQRRHLSEVIVLPKFMEALDGITEFSHLQIVFWLHKVTLEDRLILKIHPKHRLDLPLVGAFAARTKLRPNPIGISTVELVRAEGNVLTVKGLDALDGTPLLDIKPYDESDADLNPKIPQWCKQLKEEEKCRQTILFQKNKLAFKGPGITQLLFSPRLLL